MTPKSCSVSSSCLYVHSLNQRLKLLKHRFTKHYSKPGVMLLEVLPVYPDFVMWKHPCPQVIFDSDPARLKLLKHRLQSTTAN